MNKIYFYKKTRGVNYEAAHVYEHVLINAFRGYAKEKGYIEGLYGWVHGSMFYGSIILIEGRFYEKQVEKLFRDFLASEVEISDEKIEEGIATVSAEYLSDLEITDKKTFRSDIDRVSKSPFLSLDEDFVLERFEVKKWVHNPKIAKIIRNKKGFEKVVVDFNYTGKSLEEMAIVFRLWPILVDNVKLIAYAKGGYGSEILFPEFLEESDYLNMGIEIDFKKGEGLGGKLKAEIEKMRGEIVFSDHKEALEAYMGSYRDDADFAHDPEDMMKDASMLISRKKMAEIFTAENVQRVWDSLEMEIH